MDLTRIITAVCFIAAIALVISTNDFNVLLGFVLIVCSLTLWEWLRLTLSNKKIAIWLTAVWAVLVALFQYNHLIASQDLSFVAILLVGLVWLVVVPLEVYQAKVSKKLNSTMQLCMVIFAMLSMAIMVNFLAQSFDNAVTLLSTIAVLTIIWVMDIFAYIGGRKFGGTKLAPLVSPGKTWSGVVVGAVAALLWTLFMSFLANYAFAHISHPAEGVSVFSIIQNRPIYSLFLTLVVVVYSVYGDLFESLNKRRASKKDSSNLLPGHGGFYDRLDSLIPVACLVSLVQISSF